jgi:hypothetical protein
MNSAFFPRQEGSFKHKVESLASCAGGSHRVILRVMRELGIL